MISPLISSNEISQYYPCPGTVGLLGKMQVYCLRMFSSSLVKGAEVSNDCFIPFQIEYLYWK